MSERSDADEPQAALVPYLEEYSHPRWYLACASCSALVEDDGEEDRSEFAAWAWAEGWRAARDELCCPGCAAARAAQREGGP